MRESVIAAISELLIERGGEALSRPLEPVQFTGNQAADALLNDLARHPHAFALGCLMDRQQKAEKSWVIPYRFQKRLGSFAFGVLSGLSQEQVETLMREPEPLHRFVSEMARVFYLAVQQIADQYSGDASLIWAGRPSSAIIVQRFLQFHGAGVKIATMATNILLRDFKIPMSDTASIDISPDVHIRRTLTRLGLVHAGASNEEIIRAARVLHPTYPGILDQPLWEIGRNWCRPQAPDCDKCYLQHLCPSAHTEN